MIELPEANTLARQINQHLAGKTVRSVVAGQSPHKFAWFNIDHASYPVFLVGNTLLSARNVGMFVEITLSDSFLLFHDGVNLRFHPEAGPIPARHQLLLNFSDGTSLSASVAMYGGLYCWRKSSTFEYTYYDTALSKPSPLTDAFDETYFREMLALESVQKLPLKAALATEQRIPGLGNGSLQDILWNAGFHPRRKTSTLTDDETGKLFSSVKGTLEVMTAQGGKSTEKDLFGQPGGYQVQMSAGSKGKPCPQCGSEILKEAYLGGSIYTCPTCQPI
ncbi:MAG: endonuclease VIII [Chloroflexi bacterium]|jgi:formamidopyrimidine-DNA glycosylase|nr:endonuclease VIII [Chloroflexota bacterium]